jgi:hypothetical protein
VLFHESFDEWYYPGITNWEIVVADYGTLRESWSGYALQRSGTGLTPYIVPGVDSNGNTNLVSNGAGGAIRCWMKPHWGSSPTNGSGPGYNAQLLQLVATGSGPSVLIWSLQTSSDGSALELIQQSDSGPVTLLSAGINWSSNEFHQIALDYATNGTTLFLDGSNAATGSGILGVPPASAELVLGSDAAGDNAADAEFDEFFSLGQPLSAAGAAFNDAALSLTVALGPVSSDEDASFSAGFSSSADSASSFSPVGSGCVTGGQVYLTNIVATMTNQGTAVTFQIEGGETNTIYDILTTTNLAPGGNATNVVWTWLGQGYTCCTYTFLNQPNTQAFYALGRPPISLVLAWANDNTPGECDVPANLSNVVQVASGGDFTLALKSDGTLLA